MMTFRDPPTSEPRPVRCPVLHSIALFLLVVTLPTGTATERATAEVPAPPGWRLVWNDEFDGEAIDPTKWGFDLGNGFYNYDAMQWIHEIGRAHV